MYNVFLSYLRDDKPQAVKLADELQSKGAAVWVDVSDLSIGSPWREEIARAIRQAEFFIACFSSTYEERPDNGMHDELNYVVSLRKGGQKHPEILPVKLNECEIPNLQIDSDRNLNELHWYLLDDQNWQAGVTQLVEITLKMAKERAKVRLKADAEEVVVKNSQLVRSQEEFKTQESRAIRHRVYRDLNRANDQQPHSIESPDVQPPNVWPAQLVAKKEVEYQYVLSQYQNHQVEFVQRFGEEYHPLGELADKMDKEEERIHQSFADARKAEDKDFEDGITGLHIFFLLLSIVIVVIALTWSWLKSVLGF